MNTEQLISLLHNPKDIQKEDTLAFEKILNKYPYLQSVRCLHLKTLYLKNSKSYNAALKKTACYTLDRDILFEYITSEDFQTYQGMLPQEANHEASQALKVIQLKPTSTIDDLIESFDRLSNNQKAVKQNEIEKNTSFPAKERLNSIEKEANTALETQLLDTNEKINKAEKQKKQGLIDKFIETNPKIVPTKKPSLTTINIEDSLVDNNSIMTETLAKIYLDQKKYQKAIQAYEILILKYPEKSSFFADQISDIKVLQQHNN